ncbi:hypothetical protein QJ856_gp0613 [Tupanvirus deep ocean]|uniref:Uncharacterized protein n=2 Tax=Tupanvirus TaxID=2094720 RepID=A0AC62A939_9VIRU|nr:hypothetical protein QJ856_gp0613 [Tupanvirus deep ocean]QKU34133.1 hypothetical protein [Tupanvirus deep ocean]
MANISGKYNMSNRSIEIETFVDDKNTSQNIKGFGIEFFHTRRRTRVKISYEIGAIPIYMDKFIKYNAHFQEKYGVSLISDKLAVYGKKQPTKEICESIAAITHTRRYCSDLLDNSNVLCFAVADGIAPRTGILLAKLTKWNVHSIDPIMGNTWIKNGENSLLLPNLVCHKAMLEVIDESIISSMSNIDAVVVVGVHSHADLNSFWLKLKAQVPGKPIFLLSIPCCKEFEHYIKDTPPLFDIEDVGIPSPKNRVMAWTHNWKC